jgi:hypothetical protein
VDRCVVLQKLHINYNTLFVIIYVNCRDEKFQEAIRRNYIRSEHFCLNTHHLHSIKPSQIDRQQWNRKKKLTVWKKAIFASGLWRTQMNLFERVQIPHFAFFPFMDRMICLQICLLGSILSYKSHFPFCQFHLEKFIPLRIHI